MSENRKKRIRIRLTSRNPDDPGKILQALHEAFPHKKITLKPKNRNRDYLVEPRRVAEEQLEAQAVTLIRHLEAEQNPPLPEDGSDPQRASKSPQEIADRWKRIQEWSNSLLWPIVTRALYDVLKKLIGL